jgi:hypothetical protein
MYTLHLTTPSVPFPTKPLIASSMCSLNFHQSAVQTSLRDKNTSAQNNTAFQNNPSHASLNALAPQSSFPSDCAATHDPPSLSLPIKASRLGPSPAPSSPSLSHIRVDRKLGVQNRPCVRWAADCMRLRFVGVLLTW